MRIRFDDIFDGTAKLRHARRRQAQFRYDVTAPPVSRDLGCSEKFVATQKNIVEFIERLYLSAQN